MLRFKYRYLFPLIAVSLISSSVSLASVSGDSIDSAGKPYYRQFLVSSDQLSNLSVYIAEILSARLNGSTEKAYSTSRTEYFDFDDLSLLHQDSFISVNSLLNNNTPADDRITLHTSNYEIAFATRKPSKAITPQDKHQLTSRVKRADRALFTEALGIIGVNNVFALAATVTTDTQRHIYIHTTPEMNVVVVAIDIINSRILGRSKVFATLTIQALSEKNRPPADRFREELMRLFPGLLPVNSTPYRLALENGPGNMELSEFFLAHKQLYKIAQALLFGVLGLLVIRLITNRRSVELTTQSGPMEKT